MRNMHARQRKQPKRETHGLKYLKAGRQPGHTGFRNPSKKNKIIALSVTWALGDAGVEGGEVDEGVGGDEEVGEKAADHVEVAKQDATKGDAEDEDVTSDLQHEICGFLKLIQNVPPGRRPAPSPWRRTQSWGRACRPPEPGGTWCRHRNNTHSVATS